MRRAVTATVVALGFLVVGTGAALTPSDPDALHPAYAALNLPAAWDMTTGSPEIVIAIVDSGVDPTHPDLGGAVRPGYDFVADRAGAAPVDDHGTGVAGTAAARANNGVGGVGACFDCSILPLEVVGAGGIALNVHIAQAIDYAVDHGAAVVNISLIGPNSRTRSRPRACRQRARRRRGCERCTRHAAVPRRRSGCRLRRRIDVRRPPRTVLEPRVVGEVRRSRVRAHQRPRRRFRRGLRHVGVVAARRRHRRSHALAGEVRDAERHRGSSCAVRAGGAGNVLRRTRRRRSVAAARNPAPRLQPTILGTAAAGSELDAFSGIWIGSGLRTAFQWERCRNGNCSPVPGATDARYRPTEADARHRLRAVVTTDELGAAASPQTRVVETRPRLLTKPTIAGPPHVGARLRVGLGRWFGESLTYTILWERCRATCREVGYGRSYLVRRGDIGLRIRARVQAQNSVGIGMALSDRTRPIRSR